MMSCAETVKHIHEFLDKELDVTHRLVVSNHITACSGCRQRYEFERG
ncbi:MAG: zf-HC2 domain-containing protein [Planctomycetes bacterium]|nr:zf-HC2 domain-containing protein [Planctomycetota bacterium]